MHPLTYHEGQLAVQAEANTSHVAAKLAGWVGPAEEYAADADVVLLAYAVRLDDARDLRFVVLSGKPPLIIPVGPGRLEMPGRVADLVPGVDAGDDVSVGGLVLSLARAERARVNGRLVGRGGKVALLAHEEFTLCRKYMAPSAATDGSLKAGPGTREPMALDDPWVGRVVAEAETAFLGSIAPDGAPDVAHRGGPSGFLQLDATARSVAWSEFVGDGVFKSAGNVRATGTAALLVPDLATGDAVEIHGIAAYVNTLERFRPRVEPLVQGREPFPEQGRLEMREVRAFRLGGLMHARVRLTAARVTSSDTPDEQAPR